MSIVMMLYLADVSESLSTTAGVIMFLSGVTLMGIISVIMESNGDDFKSWWALKTFIPMFSISLFLFLALPEKKTIYLMASVKYGQEIAAKPGVQALGDKVLNILNDKLDSLVTKESK